MKRTMSQLKGLKHASAAASLSVVALTVAAVSMPITGTLRTTARAGRWTATKLDAGADRLTAKVTGWSGKLTAAASRHQAEAMLARHETADAPAPETFAQAATA